MDKRTAVLSLLDADYHQKYIPAAFFLHFDPSCHLGQAAVDKHLEYFHYTGMDFVKIQFEHTFPQIAEITLPRDWVNIPFYKKDFFAEPLKVVEGLVKAAKKEALVIPTLYSPFMLAGRYTTSQMLAEHLEEKPERVKHGLDIITDSLLYFVRGCIELGVDGFYVSTQGGEAGRFKDASIFSKYIKPTDLAVWDVIKDACEFNILHICDYHLPYDDLTPFLDYPGQVVNSPIQVGGKAVSGKEISAMFKRPYMGGFDRHGILVSGTPEQVRNSTIVILYNAPERFILGADCTVPSNIRWDNLKMAIDTAHRFAVHYAG